MRNVTQDFASAIKLDLANPFYNKLPKSGIYYWWCNEEGLRYLGIKLCDELNYIILNEVGFFLCYIGIGPESATSQQLLPARIQYKHISGTTGVSTLRLGIASLLRTYDESSITKFMSNHFTVRIITHNAPWDIEASEIKKYSPPLNSQHNTAGWFYSSIKSARANWSL